MAPLMHCKYKHSKILYGRNCLLGIESSVYVLSKQFCYKMADERDGSSENTRLQSVRTLESSRTSHSVMTQHENDEATFESIKAAAKRIQPHVHNTPILTSSFMNKLSGRNLYFKCENFQKTGSFKIRGATNAILRLCELKEKPPVVVTHSSGNHGQATAHAASSAGVRSIVVVPDIAPQVKKNAILGYGAEIIECAPSAKARHETANDALKGLGNEGEYVPSGDHPFVFEGQASIAIEMLNEIPNLNAVVACCSSAGLLSGVALGCHYIKPEVKVFGAEPELADDTYRSFHAGRRIPLTDYPRTIADGLRVSVGVHTWPVIQKYVTDVVTVSEEEIVRAMFLLWERMKIIVEPSGAVSLAAVLSDKFKALPPEIKDIGVVLTGGNLDLREIPWLTDPEKKTKTPHPPSTFYSNRITE